jgi:hypothetical protein
MPYAQDSEVPTYVPQDKRAQWREVFNSAHKKAKSEGKADEEAESSAFAQANGVAGPGAEKLAVGGRVEILAKITSVNESDRTITGVMAEEAPDRSNEIFDYETSKPYVESWRDEVLKISDGESYGNVRAMHGGQKVAAGKIVSMFFDDLAKRIPIIAKIVDDTEWNKVCEKVYNGFSIGGGYVKKWIDGKYIRYTAIPIEVSLVDVPCQYGATFMRKYADGHEQVETFEKTSSDDGRQTPADEGKEKTLRGKDSSKESAAKFNNREESMSPEEKERIDKLEKSVNDSQAELKKFTEAHRAHMEAIATHHQAMGHHIGQMLEPKSANAGDLSKVAATGNFVSIGKTADGVEIFKKSDAVPLQPEVLEMKKVLDSVVAENKELTENFKKLADGIKDALGKGVKVPGVANAAGLSVVSKVADGADKTTTTNAEDEKKTFTSARDAGKDPSMLKGFFERGYATESDLNRAELSKVAGGR